MDHLGFVWWGGSYGSLFGLPKISGMGSQGATKNLKVYLPHWYQIPSTMNRASTELEVSVVILFIGFLYSELCFMLQQDRKVLQMHVIDDVFICFPNILQISIKILHRLNYQLSLLSSWGVYWALAVWSMANRGTSRQLVEDDKFWYIISEI